jgi:formylglycine-generating enzyme required for sulfatase activity
VIGSPAVETGRLVRFEMNTYGQTHGVPTDGSAATTSDCASRVLRGGSWYSDPRYLRAANRYRNRPYVRNDRIGFRVARTL